MALYFLIKSNEPTFRTVVFKFKASYEHFMGWKVLINYSNEMVVEKDFMTVSGNVGN